MPGFETDLVVAEDQGMERLQLPGIQWQSFPTGVMAALGGTAEGIIKVIRGTSRLQYITYNPDFDLRLTLEIEHSQRLPMKNFGLQIGDRGLVMLYQPVVDADNIIVTVVNQEAVTVNTVINLGFV